MDANDLTCKPSSPCYSLPGLCLVWSVGADVMNDIGALDSSLSHTHAFETWHWPTTGSIVPAAIWIALETKIGIVCACLPTLLPLFRKASQAIRSQFSSLRSTRSRKSGSSGGAGPHKHGEPVIILDSENTRGGCPNCNCAYCNSSRANSNSEMEKPAKKQKGWYSAALSKVSKPETGMRSESHEEIMGRVRKEGDYIVWYHLLGRKVLYIWLYRQATSLPYRPSMREKEDGFYHMY